MGLFKRLFHRHTWKPLKEHIQEAKDSLLKNMFDALTELSRKESFWIVREQDDNRVVVGWHIEIIPMSEQQ